MAAPPGRPNPVLLGATPPSRPLDGPTPLSRPLLRDWLAPPAPWVPSNPGQAPTFPGWRAHFRGVLSGSSHVSREEWTGGASVTGEHGAGGRPRASEGRRAGG